jgi:hypothetical protein
MTSEKALYWTAVSVLALAALNGFATCYRDWAGRVATRSIAMAEQASELAAQYTGQRDANVDPTQCLRSQVRLARTRSTEARHQAELVRMQVEEIRAQVMAREIRAVVDCPERSILTRVSDRIQLVDDVDDNEQ